MRNGRLAGAAAVVAALLVASGSAAAGSVTTTIATASAGGFRVVVTATWGSGGAAPSATVNVAAFEQAAGSWRSLGHAPVGRPNGFFWKVLAGPRSIRQFSIGTSSPEHVTLQLLVTPSLGWSSLYRFHVQNARLVRG